MERRGVVGARNPVWVGHAEDVELDFLVPEPERGKARPRPTRRVEGRVLSGWNGLCGWQRKACVRAEEKTGGAGRQVRVDGRARDRS